MKKNIYRETAQCGAKTPVMQNPPSSTEVLGGKRKRKNHRPGKGERERLKAGGVADQATARIAPVIKQQTAKGDGKQQQQQKRPAVASGTAKAADADYPFEVDYNDHFETPQVAYEDLRPFLRWLFAKRPDGAGVIYDPYFCAGRMREYLRKLDFPNAINENVDFYQNVSRNKVPRHDVLVTNPPYSGDHKQRLLSYLLGREALVPFCLLLPAYTATKSYWKSFVDQMMSKHGAASLYLMPSDSYEYDHPEGTGKDIPPFYSAWFLGGFPQSQCTEIGKTITAVGAASGRKVVVLSSVEEMAEHKYVVTKRPNPKQRKKMRSQVS